MQKSIFWQTSPAVGDGAAPYTEGELFSFFGRMFVNDPTAQGVVFGYLNNLAVTGAATPVSINTGAAVVNGIPYVNDTAVTLAVPTPTLGATGHRIVLRADYTANTVRAVLISSGDGTGTPPALTQNASVWEVPLANLSITTGGVITVTDVRGYLHYNTRISGNMLDASIVDASSIEIYLGTQLRVPDNGIDDIKVGNRVPQFYRRQGGSATDWSAAGTTNYTPGAVRMQAGVVAMLIPSGGNSDQETITFPVPFSNAPISFVSLDTVGLPPSANAITVAASSVSGFVTTQLSISARTQANVGSDTSFLVKWMAIGPE